jgi:large subunit ribosomal protein L4e
MKVQVLDTKNAEKAKKELPAQFNETFRPDLIGRAVLTLQANDRQPYGAKPKAGQRQQAKISRRRRQYKTSYGHGISRVPRKIMSRHGTRMNWVAAVAPGTIGGRRAHPPKAEKIWEQKMNKKENRKAIRSAISATVQKEIVSGRGHKVPANFPFIISSEIEQISKSKDLKLALLALGFKDEMARVEERSIRAGKGKMRGRKYRSKKGPLIIVAGDCKLLKINNVPGVDIIMVNALNANVLAPGCAPGRLCLWSEAAIEKMQKENMFI